MENKPKEGTNTRTVEYLRTLDYVVDTWDADPEREDAPCEDITLKSKAGDVLNDGKLAAIIEHLMPDEVPLSFHQYGGRDKVEWTISLRVKGSIGETDVLLFSRTEYYEGNPPIVYDGRMKDVKIMR